jgi:hypothetical protein
VRRKDEAVVQPEADIAVPPRSSGWTSRVILGVAAFAIAAGATYTLAAQPRPLGVPVPPPPAPMFKVEVSATKDSSLIKRRLPSGWLARLALQPDGLPYLHDSYVSDKLGFAIRYPYGSENIQFGRDSFDKDGVDSEVNVRIDQPINAIKVSLPSTKLDKQLDFARQVLQQAEHSGAKVLDEPRDVQLPGGGFATIAYRRSGKGDDNVVHRIYCARVLKRVLIFDFFITPGYEKEGDRYAEKIMRSYEGGTLLGPVMEERAPAKADQSSADGKASSASAGT